MIILKVRKSQGFTLSLEDTVFKKKNRGISQVKAGKTSENLLNKICQIIYSLYQAK